MLYERCSLKATHDSHSLQASPSAVRFIQLMVLAKIRAQVVLPTPRGPQNRKPLERTLLEIPAGKLNKNEAPITCAHRELEEETGYKAKDMIYLGKIATAPGFCDEIIHLFKATNLYNGTKSCDEDEFTDIKKFTLDEMKLLIKKGEIIDTKTISILSYL